MHMKDSMSFSIRKDNFKRELAELRKNASDKSWALTTKISSLKEELRAMGEKI